jgi:hypothetical protein
MDFWAVGHGPVTDRQPEGKRSPFLDFLPLITTRVSSNSDDLI